MSRIIEYDRSKKIGQNIYTDDKIQYPSGFPFIRPAKPKDALKPYFWYFHLQEPPSTPNEPKRVDHGIYKDDPNVYDVERIMDRRVRCSKVEYLVKYREYSSEYNEWVIAANVTPDLIAEFRARTPGQKRKRGRPKKTITSNETEKDLDMELNVNKFAMNSSSAPESTLSRSHEEHEEISQKRKRGRPKKTITSNETEKDLDLELTVNKFAMNTSSAPESSELSRSHEKHEEISQKRKRGTPKKTRTSNETEKDLEMELTVNKFAMNTSSAPESSELSRSHEEHEEISEKRKRATPKNTSTSNTSGMQFGEETFTENVLQLALGSSTLTDWTLDWSSVADWTLSVSSEEGEELGKIKKREPLKTSSTHTNEMNMCGELGEETFLGNALREAQGAGLSTDALALPTPESKTSAPVAVSDFLNKENFDVIGYTESMNVVFSPI